MGHVILVAVIWDLYSFWLAMVTTIQVFKQTDWKTMRDERDTHSLEFPKQKLTMARHNERRQPSSNNN